MIGTVIPFLPSYSIYKEKCMKKFISKIVFASIFAACAFSSAHADALPDNLKITAKVKKMLKPSRGSPKNRKPTIVATVSIPFQQIGRAGDGKIEMTLTEQGRKKKIAKAVNLDPSSKLYTHLKSFLSQAVDEFKTMKPQSPEKTKRRTH